MFEYLRLMIFFFLGIIENLINFSASVFHFYPRLDLQFRYFDATRGRAAVRWIQELKNGKDIPKG